MSTKTKPTIFVSHRGCDVFLGLLRLYLDGYEIRVSEWNEQPGSDLVSKVQREILEADVVVVVLTASAAQSPWVNQEIGFAIARTKKVLPVSAVALPGMLAGLEHVPYVEEALEVSAFRVATGIGRILRDQLSRVFRTYHDYLEWWCSIDEGDYSSDRCYWATPHDTWSWVMSHENEKRNVPYRTLIRGNYEFDRRTVETFYLSSSNEVVCGVTQLAADAELIVIGDMSVETMFAPDLALELDAYLSDHPSGDDYIRWNQKISQRQTRIDCQIFYDRERADRHKQRLNFLFNLHKSHPART